jgi:polysaccharide pyruvyl transferase WcaK-like protein
VRRTPAVALGYQGFGNVGDEAILAGIEELLAGGALEIVGVIGGERAPIPAFPSARRITSRRLLPTPAAVRAMRQARVMIISGGGLIHDHWAIVIPRYLAWSLLARLLGLRLCWIGVGVGPIRRAWARRLAALTARLAHVRTVRDEASRDWLRRAGVRGAIEVIPDPAFFLPRQPHIGGDGLGLIVRRPVPSQAHLEGRLTDALAGLAGRHAAQSPATILTMEPDHDAGYAAVVAEAVARATGRRPPIRRLPLEAAAARAELARFDAVVSVRLHGLILCALSATTCLPVIYDDKVGGTASRLGLGELAVPLAESEARRLDEGLALAGRDAARTAVAAAVADLHDEAAEIRRRVESVAHA